MLIFAQSPIMNLYSLLLCCCVFAFPSWSLTEDEMAQFRSQNHVEQNTGIQGSVSVKYGKNGPGRLILESNGIPDHDTGTFPNNHNPNSITPQNYRWKIVTKPTFHTSTSCLPMGPIGMTVNGVPLFNPFTQTCCDAGEAELDLFDMCTGHPGPGGGYHYHIYPSCVQDIVCGQPSSIIGVAFDGFPIYGPIDENGIQLTRGDLDECNGREDSKGNYKYHIINEFPYIMGCYKGKVVDENISMKITSNCQCTEPVSPCTEFGGPRETLRKIFNWGSERKKRTSTKLFQCCTDETTCSVMRIFDPEKADGDGNGSSSVHLNFIVAVASAASVLWTWMLR